MHQEFWQQQKQQLAAALEERVLGHGEEAVYRDLVAKDVPEVFQVYLRNQARKIFQEERPVRVRVSSRYDLRDPELKRQLTAVRDTVIHGTVFKRDELRRIIEASVNIQFDVLVRPRQTMEEMLFKSQEERLRQDVVVIVQGFGEERPFVRELLIGLRADENDRLTAEEFHRLAIEVEDRIYEIKPISTFLQELTLLQQFRKKITSVESDPIDGATVLGMLAERRLDDLANGLRAEAENKTEWPLNEIEAALERVLLTRGLEAAAEVTSLEEELPQEATLDLEGEDSPLPVEFRSPSTQEVFAGVTDEDEEEPAPALEDMQPRDPLRPKIDFDDDSDRSPTSDVSPAEVGAEDSPSHAPPAQSPTPKIVFPTEDQVQIIDRQVIEQQPPGPYPPLHSLIDPRSRKMIIRKIFRKNKDEYLAFVEKLERVESWKEAKSLIDLELQRRGVSPYSKEAVRLGDILFSRYFSRSRR